MVPIVLVALVVALVLLSALAVLQVLVASGLPLGRLVWGGTHRVLPHRLRIASAASVVLYAAFAALLLSRAGVLLGGGGVVVIVLTWVLFAYFAAGVILNALSRSPAERATMAPTCAVLAAATLVIALS